MSEPEAPCKTFSQQTDTGLSAAPIPKVHGRLHSSRGKAVFRGPFLEFHAKLFPGRSSFDAKH